MVQTLRYIVHQQMQELVHLLHPPAFPRARQQGALSGGRNRACEINVTLDEKRKVRVKSRPARAQASTLLDRCHRPLSAACPAFFGPNVISRPPGAAPPRCSRRTATKESAAHVSAVLLDWIDLAGLAQCLSPAHGHEAAGYLAALASCVNKVVLLKTLEMSRSSATTRCK